MAIEIRTFSPLVPANTPATAPVIIPMTMPPRVIETVEIIVPPGPGGLVGFALRVGGTQVIPYDAGRWIVTADEKIVWPLQNYPTSGAWAFVGYNTGGSDHSVYVRFLCQDIQGSPITVPSLVADTDLDSD